MPKRSEAGLRHGVGETGRRWMGAAPPHGAAASAQGRGAGEAPAWVWATSPRAGSSAASHLSSPGLPELELLSLPSPRK